MKKENTQQFQKPKGSKKSVVEPVIFTMPEEYRHGRTTLVKSVEKKKTMPVVTAPPARPEVPKSVPTKVIKPPKGKIAGKNKKQVSPMLIIVGVVLLFLVIAGAVYVFISSSQSKTIVKQEEQKVEIPTEQPEPQPEAKPVVEPEPVVPSEPVPGTDSDSDGLSDIEEILFGSNPRLPDTDNDTYLDGNEVFHLYNPRGDAPGLITEAGFAREFSGTGFSYSVVYPSRWTVQTIDGDTEGVMFRVPTGEFMQVLVVNKDPDLAIDSWLLTQDPEVNISNVKKTKTRMGYEGITSEDKLTTYLDLGEKVYIISYNLGDVTDINFLTTYQMMVNSLEINP